MGIVINNNAPIDKGQVIVNESNGVVVNSNSQVIMDEYDRIAEIVKKIKDSETLSAEQKKVLEDVEKAAQKKNATKLKTVGTALGTIGKEVALSAGGSALWELLKGALSKVGVFF